MTFPPFDPSQYAGITARLTSLKSLDKRTRMIADDTTLGSVFNFIGVTDGQTILLLDILGSLDGDRGRSQ